MIEKYYEAYPDVFAAIDKAAQMGAYGSGKGDGKKGGKSSFYGISLQARSLWPWCKDKDELQWHVEELVKFLSKNPH